MEQDIHELNVITERSFTYYLNNHGTRAITYVGKTRQVARPRLWTLEVRDANLNLLGYVKRRERFEEAWGNFSYIHIRYRNIDMNICTNSLRIIDSEFKPKGASSEKY